MKPDEQLKKFPGLYRAMLNASTAKDVISGNTKPLPGINDNLSALYFIASAIEELAEAMINGEPG